MNDADFLYAHWHTLNMNEDQLNKIEYLLSACEYKITFNDMPLNKKFYVSSRQFMNEVLYEKNTRFN